MMKSNRKLNLLDRLKPLYYILVVAALAFMGGCESGVTGSSENSLPVQVVSEPSAPAIPYAEAKASAERLRIELAKQYARVGASERPAFIRRAGARLDSLLVQSLVPYWYGTTWDFNGTTKVPNEGAIACGYFITTLLEAAGTHLERVRLAQQASSIIMRRIDGGNKPTWLPGITPNELDAKVQNYPHGLYIIGLDFHTGFLHVHAGGRDFIHASYLDPVKVVREPVTSSPALKASNIYVIGKLTTSPYFIKAWLTGTKIKVED